MRPERGFFGQKSRATRAGVKGQISYPSGEQTLDAWLNGQANSQ